MNRSSDASIPVSYTHLDVYKRQIMDNYEGFQTIHKKRPLFIFGVRYPACFGFKSSPIDCCIYQHVLFFEVFKFPVFIICYDDMKSAYATP